VKTLVTREARRAVHVVACPYTSDRDMLFEALADNEVAMMLSWHEGFGLVGWEAIAAQVPLIVSQATGLYRLLRDERDTFGSDCVVAVDIRGTDHDHPSEEDIDAVAIALQTIAVNLPGSISRAEKLRTYLRERYTWEHCARTALEACGFGGGLPGKILPPTATAPSPSPGQSRQDTIPVVRVGTLQLEITRQDPPNLSDAQPAPREAEQRTPSYPASTISDRFAAASTPLLAWPTDLGRGEWILRPELQTLHARIADTAHSTTLLLGSAGSGKSALLARLASDLRGSGVTVLAIKADALGEEVKDAASLAAFLGLPAAVTEHVRGLSVSERVVVLLDQLDALAAIVDLHSGRLNVLLNVVRDLDGLPNVHVVCSCREFEHRRDARLTAIQAEALQLLLPTWDQVAEVLKDRGVPTDGWSPSFQDLLLPPQHLKVFLQRLTDVSERKVFSSYQQMLDDLWAKHVTNPQGPSGRSDLVMDIAAAMADRENLWVPVVLFENREALIDHLLGAGILTRPRDGAALGFAHQTLFEHARARAFARERCSLADYALARQDGLFIRSTVWAGLTYLRGGDPTNYRREFGKLWNRPDLRRHLRHLLLEFLGGAASPDSQEQAWFFGALTDLALEEKALSVVTGSPDWFVLLAKGHIPRLMRDTTANAGLLVGVLINAWRFARQECVALIREVWLPQQAKDELTWQVLSYLNTWDEEAADIACTVVTRTRINRGAILHLATQVIASSATLACRIVAAGFRRELEELERQPDPTPPPLPNDASESDRTVQLLTFKPKQRFERLLEDSNEWYGLHEFAEEAPKDFLANIWPLFSRTLGHLLGDRGSFRSQFRQDHCLGLALGDDDHRYPLPNAIDVAVQTVARTSPEQFLEFLASERTKDAVTVQRLLARGLVHLASSHPDVALQFLLEDKRRLELGSYKDQHGDTVRLVQAIVPHLTGAQFAELETAITNWSWIQADDTNYDPEERFQAQKYNRRRRLRLLATLPSERMSAQARALFQQEQLVFPDHQEAGVSRIQGGFIGSPMSAEQMQRAKNEDIVKLFRDLPDATESSHPRDWLRGGSYQASGEFERFSTASPARAVAILADFQAGKQERPAGHALVGLSKSNFPDEGLFQLLLDLDARGFRSDSFRVDAARAIQERLKDNAGLPDPICELFERWLGEPWTTQDALRAERTEQEDKRPTSVLWQRGGAYPLPYGTYQVLRALTYGYLLRTPPAADRWLAALETHAERPEQAETWLALSWDLQYLHLGDRVASRLLNRLIEKFPTMLEREEGAILLSHVWSFAPAGSLWDWLARMRQGPWKKGAQAYGELLALRALMYPEDERAQQALASALDDGGSDGGAVRTGVAFTCANMWHRADTRESATRCLTRLMACADEGVGGAVMQVFVADELLPDDSTRRLLGSLADNPAPLACADSGWFIEGLERLLPNEPETVFRLCSEVVRQQGRDLGSIHRSWALHAANLTTVALTLHRMEDPYRRMGLELFETLLSIRVPDAEAALREIDLRPRLAGMIPPQRHRRPRRKRPGAQAS
jgi:hypothetical protein